MRPIRISVEGFSAYRARVDVDLEDVEFFALSGPTGSGKSSLVDAMIFALYGRVPRLGARAVAPVITAGADRARVALEFEVNGEIYVASRVAERTDTGASVREARLEMSDGTPIASGAGEVTGAVEDLLRLRFDDFTKTVVLPQGEFARFLNAGSKERRDLLRELLGLELYAQVRELANVRKSVAAERLGSARGELSSLNVPEPGSLEDARARLSTLERLSGEVEVRLEALDGAEGELAAVEAEIDAITDAIDRLKGVEAPDHLEEMEERLAVAREAESAATEELKAKRERLESLQSRIADLPSEEWIAGTRRAYRQIEELETRIEALDVATAEKQAGEKAEAVRAAEVALADAGAALDRARVTHAAHAVGATLAVGEPCPVCAREVSELPELAPPEELTEVESRVSAASDDLRTAQQELQAARVELTEIETRRSEMSSQRESLADSVAEAPSMEVLEEKEDELESLSESIDETKSEMADLEAAVSDARRSHEDVAEAVRSVGRALMVAREQIADLKPPHSESDDPTVQWKDLLSWRDRRVEELFDQRRALARDRANAKSAVSELAERLVKELKDAGVPTDQPYAVQIAREVEITRQRVSQIEDVLARSESLEKQVREAVEDEAVAAALAGHLKANGFERWLMAGAITGLVDGANQLLSQLSGGGYALESDEDGSFRVIDHRNADELRDVATLSGGETFLVSLALSLSLAETLSASGGAGLDAIILDEGFGSLDEESLDTVAAVLEELAGKGLMVGVITHVKELAVRAPVRYQVTREPGGSRVEVVT